MQFEEKEANKKKTQNAQPSRLSKESHNVTAIGAMHTLVQTAVIKKCISYSSILWHLRQTYIRLVQYSHSIPFVSHN